MAISMNEHLSDEEMNKPMDWRFRNLLISYILYYSIVITNFIDCMILWYLFCIFFIAIA